MSIQKIQVRTEGERLYDITSQVQSAFLEILESYDRKSGVLVIYCMHTSCGLTINESYAPEAAEDMSGFLKHIAPRDLKFIKHTDEGPDDSPSHMKTMVTSSSLSLIVEKGEIVIGQWQGLFLCEFRDQAKLRTIILKYQPD